MIFRIVLHLFQSLYCISTWNLNTNNRSTPIFCLSSLICNPQTAHYFNVSDWTFFEEHSVLDVPLFIFPFYIFMNCICVNLRLNLWYSADSVAISLCICMYFFLKMSTKWALDPKEKKEQRNECILKGVLHLLWHLHYHRSQKQADLIDFFSYIYTLTKHVYTHTLTKLLLSWLQKTVSFDFILNNKQMHKIFT